MDITLERILSLIPRKPDGKYVHGSRKEFAQSIGLESGNLIADWENGRNKSYKNYLYEIAAKYDVSVEWLKGETDEKKPAQIPGELDETTKAIFAEIDSMESEADKLLALEMIRAIKRRRTEA